MNALIGSFSPAVPTCGAPYFAAGAQADARLLGLASVGNPCGSQLLHDVQRNSDASTSQLLLRVVQLLAGLLVNQQLGAQQQGASPASNGSGGSASAAGGGSNIGSNESATGRQVDRQGKKLDASIADNFDAMVAAAKRDGVDLQIVSGWRSRQEQEVLYQKYLNGTGNLAAKPGTSNHESGQAIDFKNTPGAFAWLKKNAEKFGLKNLPGEPWHYSVNGK